MKGFAPTILGSGVAFIAQLRTHLNINDIKANTKTKTLSLGLMKKKQLRPRKM